MTYGYDQQLTDFDYDQIAKQQAQYDHEYKVERRQSIVWGAIVIFIVLAGWLWIYTAGMDLGQKNERAEIAKDPVTYLEKHHIRWNGKGNRL